VTPKRSPRAPHIASSRALLVSMSRLVSEHFVSAITPSHHPPLIDPFHRHPTRPTIPLRRIMHQPSPSPAPHFRAPRLLVSDPDASFSFCSTFLSLYYTGFSRDLSAICLIMSPRSSCLCPVSHSSSHYLTSFLSATYPACPSDPGLIVCLLIVS
jgi:hypothetical protein